MITFFSLFSMLTKAYPLSGVEKDIKDLHKKQGRPAPQWIHDGPLYEIYVRAFSDSGTFKAVQKRLPYLKELGVGTIWLMPVYPIGTLGRKGRLGSPYSVRDYYRLNGKLGNEQELKDLIKAVHASGMHIIVDMVANHVSNDYVAMNDHPDMFMKDEEGAFTREVADWSDVTDFDYSKPETREYMKAVLEYWVSTFHFDGFRCDVAGMVPLDFWQDAVAGLLSIKPDLYMLAEWEDPELHLHAFNSTYDWTLYHLLKDIYAGKKKAALALEWVEEKKNLYPQQALPLRFIENHDEQRAAHEFGRSGYKPFAVFIFSMYGVPLLYNGQEWGETEKPSLFDKEQIHWEKQDLPTLHFYTRLIALRKKYPAFASGALRVLANDHPENVLSYIKKAGDERILFILNLCDENLKVRLTPDSVSAVPAWFDLLHDKNVKPDFVSKALVMEPFGIKILRAQMK